MLRPYSRRRAIAGSIGAGLATAHYYRNEARALGRGLRTGYNFVKGKVMKWSRKRKGRSQSRPAKKRRIMNDPTSYVQLRQSKHKYGRKLNQKFRDMKLVKSVSAPLRYHFGNVKDINSAEGSYWLSQQQYNATNYRLPVYLFNLFTLSQLANGVVDTDKQAYPAFELYRNIVNGVYSWGPVPGLSTVDGTTPTYVKERIAPTPSTDHTIGRKGMIDWSRVKVCIWGKKQNPTRVRVRLIRFTDEEFCPEFTLNRANGFTVTTTNIKKVNEYWENVMKYDLNGPQGSAPRSDKKRYVKVLKEFIVNMNPVDAAAEVIPGDPRAHMRHIDIFNRWGRVMDYTEPDATAGVGIADLRNVNKFDQPSREYSGYLRRADQAVYVMIDSVQPYEEPTTSNALPRPVPSTADGVNLTASFDISIDTNFTVIEKAV